MRKLTALVLLPVALGTLPAAHGASRPAAGPAALGAAGATVHGASSITAKVVARNLNFPAAFTFGPGGGIWYGERGTGEIHVIGPKGRSNSLFFRIPHVVAAGEQGLLGLALDPDFPSTPLVYAYATRKVHGAERDQVVRIEDDGGHGTGLHVIWSSPTEAGVYHDGGRIEFGPDGKLYAIQGEAHDAANSQDLSNDAGKILRMTAGGKPAPGNPFPGKRVFAYGIRNSFGFDFDPQTGRLWETENGPSCNDELNRIVAGRNYGWGPHQTCSTPPDPPRNTRTAQSRSCRSAGTRP
jgi:glucose/arabinose dehydrogenase